MTSSSVQEFVGFETIAHFASCVGVHPDDIAQVDALYAEEFGAFLERRDELLKSSGGKNDLLSGSTFEFKWMDPLTCVHESAHIPRYAVRTLVTALYKAKPVPLHEVRQEFAHGRCSYMGAYSPDAQKYIEFAMKVCDPLVRLRIFSEESRIRARDGVRVYAGSRQVGHTGRERLFSESDILDILDKTMLIVFCPLIARTIPLQGIGTGYAVFEQCTNKVVVGKRKRRTYNVHTEVLEQHQDEGYWVLFTDELTGERVCTFTESENRADELHQMSGIMGVVDSELRPEKQEHLKFGNPVLYADYEPEMGNGKMPTLVVDSIVPYRPDRVFSSVLVGAIRTHFRSLTRRTDREDELITEHAKKRERRQHDERELPLWEVLEYYKEQLDLNDFECDMLQAEICTEDELKQWFPGIERGDHRRVQIFRQLREERTGELCKVGRTKYYEALGKLRTKLAQFSAEGKFTQDRKGNIRVVGESGELAERQPSEYTLNAQPIPQWRLHRDRRTFQEVLDQMFGCGVERRVPTYPLAQPGFWNRHNFPVCDLLKKHRLAHRGPIGYGQRATSAGGTQDTSFELLESENVQERFAGRLPPKSALCPEAGTVVVQENTIMVRATARRTLEECRKMEATPGVRKYTEYKTVWVEVPCWTNAQGDVWLEQNHDDV